MSKIQVKLNTSGVRSLLQSEEVQTCLNQYGQRALQRIPPKYSSEIEHGGKVGKNRAKYYIKIDPNTSAFWSNRKTNWLIKAVKSK